MSDEMVEFGLEYITIYGFMLYMCRPNGLVGFLSGGHVCLLFFLFIREVGIAILFFDELAGFLGGFFG